MKKEFLLLESEAIIGKEFENAKFEVFYNEHGIKKEFSTAKTPQ